MTVSLKHRLFTSLAPRLAGTALASILLLPSSGYGAGNQPQPASTVRPPPFPPVVEPFETLANFAIEHDSYGNSVGENTPVGKVVQKEDGTVYVACRNSADISVPREYGRILKVKDGLQYNVHTFLNLSEAGVPEAGLTLGSDGNIYGTTSYGGTYGYGTIYKLTPNDQFTVLHSFNEDDGESPDTELVEGPDGCLYGTCEFGGTFDIGTVFKITTTGTLTVLHNFGGGSSTTSQRPSQGLALGNDGNFYGTTIRGGLYGYGVVYKITPAGVLTAIHDFNSASNGGFAPSGALVQAQDGNFYGPCAAGGLGYGLLYRITPTGQFTTIYTFYGYDGVDPYGQFLLGDDGTLYGTASGGGTGDDGRQGDGIVFALDPLYNLDTLHVFRFGAPSGKYYGYTEGDSPLAPLVFGTDGRIYGVTGTGGAGFNGPGSGGVAPYDFGGTLFSLPTVPMMNMPY